MTKWLIFTDISLPAATAQFNALNATLNTAFGYPTLDGRTLTYAKPFQMPASGPVLSFSLAMPIEDRCLPFLTPIQISSLKTLDDLFQTGWFIEPTDPVAKKAIGVSSGDVTPGPLLEMSGVRTVVMGAQPMEAKQPSFWQRNKVKIAAAAAAAAAVGAAAYHFLAG